MFSLPVSEQLQNTELQKRTFRSALISVIGIIAVLKVRFFMQRGGMNQCVLKKTEMNHAVNRMKFNKAVQHDLTWL